VEPKAATITRSNADCVLGYANGIAVALWRYNTTAPDVQELERTALLAHGAHARPIALIQVVPASALTPDAAARTALARMLLNLNGRVSHSALVHEAEGFRAAMIRSIVTGIAALSNPGFPHRVFARLEEAVAWMTPKNPHGRVDALRFTEAVAKVRAVNPLAKNADPRALEARPR
jgi:hypothetical protein